MGLDGPATSAAYAEEGRKLIFGLLDGRLEFFQREGFIKKAHPKKHQKSIKKIIYLENIKKTVVCDVSGKISVWETLSVENAEIRKENEISKQISLFKQSGAYKTGMMME